MVVWSTIEVVERDVCYCSRVKPIGYISECLDVNYQLYPGCYLVKGFFKKMIVLKL